MEIFDDKVLARNIFQKYTANPKNWNFVISTSTSIHDGFFDAAITSPDESWQLKIDSLYKPLPIITGTKLDIESSKISKMTNKNMVPFGYRKIDTPMIMNLFKKISQEQEIIARKDIGHINNELNSFLGSIEPTIPEKGIDYLYGPFLFTNKNIIDNNPYQRTISEKLTTNLKKKIKERYPSYG
jgi:hypothetical protein